MNVANWITGWARQRAVRPAIHFEDNIWTYGQLADLISAGAEALARSGIGTGDRVALLGYNTPQYLCALFACARLRAIAVPLNWRLAPPEHDYILADSGARLLLVDSFLLGSVEALKAPLDTMLLDGAVAGWECLDWETVSAASAALIDSGDKPLLLVYTSGTTGRPKGALLSHRALWVNAVNGIHAHESEQHRSCINQFTHIPRGWA